MPSPPPGFGQAIADLETAIERFTVTIAINAGIVTFTLVDTQGLLTLTRMVRAVLADAIDQWLATNDAQLQTNGATLRGSDGHPGTGDGFQDFEWNYGAKTAANANTITTTSLTTADIVAEVPFADVV